MSILLDALKRSEEQRRLGHPPDIHSPSGEHSDLEPARRKWLWLVALALCAVAVAWFGWRYYQQAAVTAPPAATPGEASIPAGEIESAGAPTIEQSDGPTVGSGPRTPVESYTVESTTAGPGAGESTGESATSASAKADLNRSFTQFQAPAEADSASQQGQSPPKPAASTAGPRAAAKSPGRGQQQAAATEPISYWELPQGIRDSLPDLRITVLVYAEQPANRFVLMGGQRRVEKDQIQDGLVLEEIRREGAVFVYRNYRFLVEG
jgi:general secretion pathway protein B